MVAVMPADQATRQTESWFLSKALSLRVLVPVPSSVFVNVVGRGLPCMSSQMLIQRRHGLI